MSLETVTLESGTVYQVEIPDLTVAAARLRLTLFRSHLAEQTRLEGRVEVIDRFYDRLTSDSGDDDIDTALAKLDAAAERSRLATEELAAYADSKTMVEFFCDSIEGIESFTELPARDVSELYRMVRGLMMGRSAPVGEAVSGSST